MDRKIVSIIILVSFVFSITPAPYAFALRNSQAGDAPATGRALGGEMQAGAAAARGGPEKYTEAAAIGTLASLYEIETAGKSVEQVYQELAQQLIEDNLLEPSKPLSGITRQLLTEDSTREETIRALRYLFTTNRDELIIADPHATLEGPGKLALAFPNAEITVAGDLLDRGSDLLPILDLKDKLVSNLVWGDHDLWALGAILGNDLLLAQWLQINYRYDNEYVLTQLGLNMGEFRDFAEKNYSRFKKIGTETGAIDEEVEIEGFQAPKDAKNIYALAALNIFMKLQGNVSALARIPDGQIVLNGPASPEQVGIIEKIRNDITIEDSGLSENELATLRNYFLLTPEENAILDDLYLQMASSKEIQRLRKVLMKGSLFRRIPNEPAIRIINKKLSELLPGKWENLPTVVVLHNVPATNKQGKFVDIKGEPIEDKDLEAYYVQLENELRELNDKYLDAIDSEDMLRTYREQNALKIEDLQLLADGINSPVYGKDFSQRGPSVYCSTSPHYKGKKIEEPENPSTELLDREDSGFGKQIAEAFGVEQVVLGHTANKEGTVIKKQGGQVLMADPHFAEKKGGKEATGMGAAVLVGGGAISIITLDPTQRNKLNYRVETFKGKLDLDSIPERLTATRGDYNRGRSEFLTTLIEASAVQPAAEFTTAELAQIKSRLIEKLAPYIEMGGYALLLHPDPAGDDANNIRNRFLELGFDSEHIKIVATLQEAQQLMEELKDKILVVVNRLLGVDLMALIAGLAVQDVSGSVASVVPDTAKDLETWL